MNNKEKEGQNKKKECGLKQEIILVNGEPIKNKYPIINDGYIVFTDEPYKGD